MTSKIEPAIWVGVTMTTKQDRAPKRVGLGDVARRERCYEWRHREWALGQTGSSGVRKNGIEQIDARTEARGESEGQDAKKSQYKIVSSHTKLKFLFT